MIIIPVHRLHIPTGTDHIEEKSFESLWDAYKHINEWNALQPGVWQYWC